MINIPISNEQFITVFENLPKKQKKQILNDFMIEEWLGTPEALNLKKEADLQIKNGQTMTTEEIREKIKKRGY